MNKIITKTCLLAALVLCVGLSAQAQVIPTPSFTNFYNDASTFNGVLLPVGSVVDAYDSTGVHCGTFTVHTTGSYGFMPTYGDDATTTGVDEGAETGETIFFKINGRDATVVAGDDTWTDQANKDVQLSVTTPSISFSLIDGANDTLAAPGWTVRMFAGVRNDGDGLDMFGVTAEVDQVGWNAVISDSLFYAEIGETTYVYFDIEVPVFPGDTAAIVTYTLYSKLDTTVTVTDSANLYVSITDVDDGKDGTLPVGFALGQNYPNPFNPSTIIPFSLPAASTVRLDVFDALGRQIESRDLGYMSAGDYEVDFEASALASGVYFYRLTSDQATMSRKMLLLK